MRRAIVVGSEGQDGRLLFDRLSADGYEVLGLGKEVARRSDGKPEPSVDIIDANAVAHLLAASPSDVYFLAAVHQSSEAAASLDDPALFQASWDVHVRGLINFLEPMARHKAGALFYAASSHVFGEPDHQPQTEGTPFRPASPYAITKAAGVHVCQYYRTTRNVAVSCGILYNHESHLRADSFLSQRIAKGVAKIAKTGTGQLRLGSLQSTNDWGYAPDFIDAMVRIVSRSLADDFIIATGEPHTVQDFVQVGFNHVDLDWRDHVIEDPALLTRTTPVRIGDATRLNQATGWKPTISFEEMVRKLVDAAMRES